MLNEINRRQVGPLFFFFGPMCPRTDDTLSLCTVLLYNVLRFTPRVCFSLSPPCRIAIYFIVRSIMGCPLIRSRPRFHLWIDSKSAYSQRTVRPRRSNHWWAFWCFTNSVIWPFVLLWLLGSRFTIHLHVFYMLLVIDNPNGLISIHPVTNSYWQFGTNYLRSYYRHLLC